MDNPDFVNALCDWIADPARADLERVTAPFELFAHSAEEVAADPAARNYADPYTVVRAYGGEAMSTDPMRSTALQFYTVGNIVADCMARAETLFSVLLGKALAEDDGTTPIRNVALFKSPEVSGWKLIAITNLRPPGLIGRDSQQRAEIVFNCDASYFFKPA